MKFVLCLENEQSMYPKRRATSEAAKNEVHLDVSALTRHSVKSILKEGKSFTVRQ